MALRLGEGLGVAVNGEETMASKEAVDRAMRAFEATDNFGRGLTARLYGVKASEGMDGMRAAFTQADEQQVLMTADDLEDEARHLGDDA